jgi:hypothetical protein
MCPITKPLSGTEPLPLHVRTLELAATGAGVGQECGADTTGIFRGVVKAEAESEYPSLVNKQHQCLVKQLVCMDGSHLIFFFLFSSILQTCIFQ